MFALTRLVDTPTDATLARPPVAPEQTPSVATPPMTAPIPLPETPDMAETDDQGRFEITGLTEGPYMVSVINLDMAEAVGETLDLGGFTSLSVQVRDGEIVDVKLGKATGVAVKRPELG